MGGVISSSPGLPFFLYYMLRLFFFRFHVILGGGVLFFVSSIVTMHLNVKNKTMFNACHYKINKS